MSFAMRVNFVDVICEDSLRNTYLGRKKSGFQFEVRLSYYRGHFLSDIDVLEVFLDGVQVKEEDILFCLNGKEFTVGQLGEAYTEFWRLLDPAVIRIHHPGGLEDGEHHIRLNLMMRVPYLPLPGSKSDHDYMPLDAGGEKCFVLQSIPQQSEE